MMRIKVFSIFILVLMVLSSCGPKVTQQAGLIGSGQSWIDAPMPGSHLPLEAVEIVAHAANPDGISTFEINLNGQLLAKTSPDPASTDPTLIHTRYSWLPAAPGRYLIEVTAYDLNNQAGPPAQVIVEVGEPTPTIALTETQTPTPTCGPLTFSTNINAYCREGPGEVFPPLEDPAMKGVPYLMDGRNLDGTWYRIMLTPNQGCWVPAGVGMPSCDPGKLRVLSDIPTPEIYCSSYTDQTTCEAHVLSCKWNFTLAGTGVCTNK